MTERISPLAVQYLVRRWGENDAGLSCSENRGMEPPMTHRRKDMMIATCRRGG